jgi:hypothetical protein
MELAGAFGDLGTPIPFVVAVPLREALSRGRVRF